MIMRNGFEARIALAPLLVLCIGCARHPRAERVESGRVRDEDQAKYIAEIDINLVRRLQIAYTGPNGKGTKILYVSDRGEITRVLDAIASASHLDGKPAPSKTSNEDWGIEIDGGGGDYLGIGGLRDELVERWGPEVTAAVEAHDPWPLPQAAQKR